MKKVLAVLLMLFMFASITCTAYAVALSEKVWFVYDELVVEVGEVFPLGLETYPENSGDHFSYSFSKKNVVKLTEYYEFVAVGEGTTTVTVKGKLTGLKDSFKVTVIDPNKVHKIVLDQSGTVTLNMGELLQLNASIEPETAQSKLKWSTSSKKIAIVDGNGTVTPVKEGTATITVKSENGKKDTVKVKVVDPYKPSKVVLDQSGTVLLGMGETLQLNAALQPETAKSALKWTSSSKKIAAVDENGVVTPVKEGTATITVKTANGKKDTVKVKVVDPYKPSKVVLDQSGTVTVEQGKTIQLNATLQPATAQTVLKWKSSNTKVAKVDQNGLVSCIKPGKVTITVSSANGIKDTVKVTVLKQMNDDERIIQSIKDAMGSALLKKMSSKGYSMHFQMVNDKNGVTRWSMWFWSPYNSYSYIKDKVDYELMREMHRAIITAEVFGFTDAERAKMADLSIGGKKVRSCKAGAWEAISQDSPQNNWMVHYMPIVPAGEGSTNYRSYVVK